MAERNALNSIERAEPLLLLRSFDLNSKMKVLFRLLLQPHFFNCYSGGFSLFLSICMAEKLDLNNLIDILFTGF